MGKEKKSEIVHRSTGQDKSRFVYDAESKAPTNLFAF